MLSFRTKNGWSKIKTTTKKPFSFVCAQTVFEENNLQSTDDGGDGGGVINRRCAKRNRL